MRKFGAYMADVMPVVRRGILGLDRMERQVE